MPALPRPSSTLPSLALLPLLAATMWAQGQDAEALAHRLRTFTPAADVTAPESMAALSGAEPGNPAMAPAPTLPAAVSMRPAPGLEIRYGLLNESEPGPGRLDGIVSGSRWELRGSMLLEPGETLGPRTLRLDSGAQVDTGSGLGRVVVGDTLASGGGWSRPVRLGGIRIGRPLTIRPGFDAGLQSRVAGVAALPTAGLPLAGESGRRGWGQAATAMPGAGAASRGPAVAGPSTLGAGASDYELEVGRVRSGWGTADDHYEDPYAAAAYRHGLADGLSAEWRAEWMQDRQATGLELVHSLGPVGLVNAVVAHSAAEELSGTRWGIGATAKALQSDWRLSWDSFERGFTPVAHSEGEVDPRSRLQAAVTTKLLGNNLQAGLSYARQTGWDAADAQVVGITAQWRLQHGRSVSLDLRDRSGDQAMRQGRVVYTLPLDRGG